ncbi:MAG: hypothetical protein J2P54_12015 [Bradyrhizobiaceae bacterium]|nr:hypothetical protein [Bradyrhizobiaceae bacterium]
MPSSPVLSAQDLGRVKQAMLLGLARQPLGIPEPLQPLATATADRDAVLTVLALAGQQQRFQRPARHDSVEPISEAARRMHEDPRPILPEAARRALLRLANGVEKSLADAVLSAAARRVAASGFRLHPFDLPRLIAHIKADARCLGLAERAYLALTVSSEAVATPTVLDNEITRENWTGFQKIHRIAFLRSERRKHAAAARALLQDVFKSEPANVRGDLLSALDVGLGVDDLPFLESLANDRADSVRAAAARLVAAVPGTPDFTARLSEAAGCFVRSSLSVGGILNRIGLADKAAVTFKPTASANRGERHTQLARLFEGFSAAEVGAAAGLTVAEVIAAIPTDAEAVFVAFSQRAMRDDDTPTMMQLAKARLTAAETPAHVLAWLASNLTEPASLDFGHCLLRSDVFEAALQRFQEADTPSAMKDDGTLIWTAAVLPTSLLASFLAKLEPLLPATTRAAREFVALVLALGAPT